MQTFSEYMASQLDTHRWMVAPRLTKLATQAGYQIAISQKRYRALRLAWLRLAAIEAGNIFAKARKDRKNA